MTAAPGGECVFGGHGGKLRHHPTGRGGGRYFDPDFTVPVCHDDHALVHDDWYSAGAADTWDPPTLVHLLEVSFRRVGMLLGRLAAEGVLAALTAPLAAWLAKSADRLETVRGALDVGAPGWDRLPGIDLSHA